MTDISRQPVQTRAFTLPGRVDLGQTLSYLRAGSKDPTSRLAGNAWAHACRTPEGPVTLRLDVHPATTTATASAVGPGADWALHRAPDLLGCRDDTSDFNPAAHEVVARFARRLPGFRIGRSGLVADVLARTILAQKVTILEAVGSWLHLVDLANEPAPRGTDLPELQLPPASQWLAELPLWQYTAAGVDRSRAVTLKRSHARIDALQAAEAMPRAQRRERMTAVPGLGPWTAAIVERCAFGDPDAIQVGDFHLPNFVAWNLAREPRADDDRMLELLAPFAGHRARVARMVEIAGARAPAYGPRLAPRRFGARTRPSKGR